MEDKPQGIDDMFGHIGEEGTVSMDDFASSSEGSSRGSSDEKEKWRPLAKKIQKEDGLKVFYDPNTKKLRQKSPNPDSEKRFMGWAQYPMARVNPEKLRKRGKSPPIQHIKAGTSPKPEIPSIGEKWMAAVKRGAKHRKEKEKEKEKEERKSVAAIHPIQGGRKTRKKSRRFRNNYKKNKMSRNYIMLKQCGGGKAKMGSKSKPYSSKRKAMRSRRRVCYYKKKGRTLKLKKKAKKSKKRSRRRRR